MNDALVVAVLDGLHNLTELLSSIVFRHASLLEQIFWGVWREGSFVNRSNVQWMERAYRISPHHWHTLSQDKGVAQSPSPLKGRGEEGDERGGGGHI